MTDQVLLCLPDPFTPVVGSASAAARPIGNLADDEPGMVWRSAGLESMYIVIRVDRDFDTVGLVGSNLRANDVVRIRTGVSAEACVSAPVIDNTVVAYQGVKSDASTTQTLVYAGATQTARFVRLDFGALGHPGGFVQAQRLVIGTRLSHRAIDKDSELGLVDSSPAYTGPNWSAFETYVPLTEWKAKFSWIKDADWRGAWWPFLQRSGITQPFLFVPVLSDPTRYPAEMIFGRSTTSAKGQHPSSNLWSLEMTIRAIAP